MYRFLFFVIIVIGLGSCYNYEGPTRPRKEYYYPAENGSDYLNTKPNISSKEYLDDIVRDIKRTLPSAQVQVIEDSIKVLFPDNILYGNSSVIPIKDIFVEMKKLAKLIIKYDQTNVLVTGHTDKSGQEKENKRLSALRAGYIRDLLIANKAPQIRVNSWGLGSSVPIASERTTAGKNKNRRVEFIILSTIEDEEEF